MTKQADQQNMIVKEHLARTTLAVNCLAGLGITVVDVCLGKHVPNIEVLPSSGCKQLTKDLYTKSIIRSGSRFIETSASVANCRVHWEEAA